MVKDFQETAGLPVTGIVDQDTWKMIQAQAGDINTSEENTVKFQFGSRCVPGEYTVHDSTLLSELDKMAITVESFDKNTNIKSTAVTKYKNNKYKTISSTETLNGSETVRMSNFVQNFLYDPQNGEPESVEVTIFAEDADTYKWFFTLES